MSSGWYEEWDGPEEDIPSPFYTQIPNVGDILTYHDVIENYSLHYLVLSVTPEKVVLQPCNEFGLTKNDGVTIEIDTDNWEQWAESYQIILEDQVMIEPEPSGELWPDTIPWGEAEQDYYRTAAWWDHTKFKKGDRIYAVNAPDYLGTVVEPLNPDAYGGRGVYRVKWDDGTEGSTGEHNIEALEGGTFLPETPRHPDDFVLFQEYIMTWMDMNGKEYPPQRVRFTGFDGSRHLYGEYSGVKFLNIDLGNQLNIHWDHAVWMCENGCFAPAPRTSEVPAPDEEVVDEMWPDFLPWGEAEQDFYRHSQWLPGEAPSVWSYSFTDTGDFKGGNYRDHEDLFEGEGLPQGKEIVRGHIMPKADGSGTLNISVMNPNVNPADIIPTILEKHQGMNYEPEIPVTYWQGAGQGFKFFRYDATSGNLRPISKTAGMFDWWKRRDQLQNSIYTLPWIWTPEGFYCSTCGEGPWANEKLVDVHIEGNHPERKLTKWRRHAKLRKVTYPVLHTMLDADPSAKAATDALTAAGGQVYIVGGAVRDAVLGRNPKDVDLMVSGLTEDQITQALSPLGKLNFTGAQFGVFRFRQGDNPEVEIALPRTERSTGPAYTDFEVTTDPFLPIDEDLRRRDFTGNAMAYAPVTQELVDPYGGADDLGNSQLRLVNPDAFRDDPLRVVRALVANARFGLEPDDELRQALADNAHRIKNLPGERIQMELDKLLSGTDPAEALQLAEESGIIDYLIPELSSAIGFDQMNPHHDLDVFSHTLQVLRRMSDLSNDPDLRLAALLHDSGKPASFWRDEEAPEGGGGHFYKKIDDDGTVHGDDHEVVGAELADAFMRRLRYPNERRERVVDLIRNHMFPYFDSTRGARKLLASLGGDVNTAFDLLKLREADASGKASGGMSEFDTASIARARELLQQALNEESATTVKDLAVNGHDMMELGLEREEIGQKLKELLELVVENPELNERDTLLELARS